MSNLELKVRDIETRLNVIEERLNLIEGKIEENEIRDRLDSEDQWNHIDMLMKIREPLDHYLNMIHLRLVDLYEDLERPNLESVDKELLELQDVFTDTLYERERIEDHLATGGF